MTRHRRKRPPVEVQAAIARPGDQIDGVSFDLRHDLHQLMLKSGLVAMQALFSEEVARLCGDWHAHDESEAYR